MFQKWYGATGDVFMESGVQVAKAVGMAASFDGEDDARAFIEVTLNWLELLLDDVAGKKEIGEILKHVDSGHTAESQE